MKTLKIAIGQLKTCLAALLLGAVLLASPALAVAGSGPNLSIQEFSVSVGSAGWQDNVSVSPGDELWFQLIIHNTNVPSTAEHLTVKVDLPSDADGSLTVAANVSSPTPTTVSGSTNNVSASVKIAVPSGARLRYRSDSLRLTWDPDGDGVKDYNGSPWPGGDGDLTLGGIDFGSLEGCNQYVIQLLFAADVISLSPPRISLEKKVRFDEKEVSSVAKKSHLFGPGEKITYRLFVANSGEQAAKNVKIEDPLPPYLEWVEGDGSYDSGADRVNFDLGTLEAKESRTLTYIAQVIDSMPEGEYSQDNVAKVYEDGQERDQGRAFVWVSKPGEVKGEILAAATELPVSGGGSDWRLVLAVGGGLMTIGRLLRRHRAKKYRHFKSDYWR